MRSNFERTTIVRSTLSRRARNSASVITGRRRPASRPSRRRCFFASRRVEPRTFVGSLLSSAAGRGVRTFTTVFVGFELPELPVPESRSSSPARRRERRRTVVCSPSSSRASLALFCSSLRSLRSLRVLRELRGTRLSRGSSSKSSSRNPGRGESTGMSGA